MSDLQTAIELVARDMEFMNKRLLQEGITPDPQSDLVLEAARLVANVPTPEEISTTVNAQDVVDGWFNKFHAQAVLLAIGMADPNWGTARDKPHSWYISEVLEPSDELPEGFTPGDTE